MAARPAGKGGASMRRAGGLSESDDDVVGTFDDPGERAAAKRRDNAAGKAYKQGQAAAKRRVQETGKVRGHEAAQVHEDPEHQELYEHGFHTELGDQRKAKRQKTFGKIGAPVKSAAGGAAHDGAGVLLGMIAYALFLAYVKGGTSGVKQWLGAKFLNKTITGPAPTPQNPTGVPDADKTGNNAWIMAHLGQWPHPGSGANDFWNALAQMIAKQHGITMTGQP